MLFRSRAFGPGPQRPNLPQKHGVHGIPFSAVAVAELGLADSGDESTDARQQAVHPEPDRKSVA